MDIEKKDNVIKVSIPAITDDEIIAIDNNFNEISKKFAEMINHNKELIVAQRVVQNLRAELDKKESDLYEANNRINDLLEIADNKDKIINEMAEQLAGLTIWNNKKEEPLILMDKQEVIDYFTKKVEGK